MGIAIGIRPDRFARELARAIVAGNRAVADIIERLIAEHFQASVSAILSDYLVRPPRVIVHPNYKKRFASLAELSQDGFTTWYPEVLFAIRHYPISDPIHITTTGIEHGYTKYDGTTEQEIRHTTRELKTQVNHTVRLNQVRIPKNLFSYSTEIVEQDGPLQQPYMANLTVGCENYIDDRIEGFRLVSFDHIVRGDRLFCSCHEPAHAVMLAEARTRLPLYTPGSWPYHVVTLLRSATYAKNLCHLCLIQLYGEEAAADWYGTAYKKYYAPYVDLLVRGSEMDIKTAKAEAQRRLSISRWVSEDELFRLISELFPENEVRREASPPWLGRQRLDIFLPELNLAIEYQGEQHYRPVGAFGGEQGFLKLKERDKRKRALCSQNGVAVVDIRYDAPLTLPSLRSRLRRWLTGPL